MSDLTIKMDFTNMEEAKSSMNECRGELCALMSETKMGLEGLLSAWEGEGKGAVQSAADAVENKFMTVIMDFENLMAELDFAAEYMKESDQTVN